MSPEQKPVDPSMAQTELGGPDLLSCLKQPGKLDRICGAKILRTRRNKDGDAREKGDRQANSRGATAIATGFWAQAGARETWLLPERRGGDRPSEMGGGDARALEGVQQSGVSTQA